MRPLSSISYKTQRYIVALLFVNSTVGFGWVVGFYLSPFAFGLEYYMVAAPLFLALFLFSVGLVLRSARRMGWVSAISLLAVFPVGFFFMVPVQVTSTTIYDAHCPFFYTIFEWKSLSYTFLGLGFHVFRYNITHFCQ